MKKKLLLMTILTGVILMASFSVFGASDSVSFIYQYGIGGYADINGQTTSREVNVKVIMQNNSDKWAVSSADVTTVQIDLGTLGSNSYMNGMSIVDNELCSAVLDNSRYLTVYPRVYVTPDIGFILAPHEYKVLSFTIKFEVVGSFTSNVLISQPSGTPIFNFKTIEELSEFPRSELSLLDRIRLALESDSSVTSDLDSKSNSVNQQESVIHQQEQQWFNDNQVAINNVGLDNFQFNQGTIGGFQIMQQQFANVWSALGDLNLIYTFTLMVSLATFIIRHWPRTKQTETLTETETSSIDLISGKRSHRITSTRSRRIK